MAEDQVTVICRKGTFLAEYLPTIAPESCFDEAELDELGEMILEIMRDAPPRFTTVEAEEADLPWMLRDYASVLRCIGARWMEEGS